MDAHDFHMHLTIPLICSINPSSSAYAHTRLFTRDTLYLLPFTFAHLVSLCRIGEFNSAISSLVTDTKLLSNANEKAQKLAEVARTSVDAFIGAASTSLGNLSMYSVPRQRWIRAINRVMYDNYVTKYITPLLAPAMVVKHQRHVTFQLPKIEEKASPSPNKNTNKKKPVVSQAHTRKTVLS